MKILKLLLFFVLMTFGRNSCAQTIYELVMSQRPAALSGIEFNTGTLGSTKWPALEFSIYQSPDAASSVLWDKQGLVLYKEGVPFCEFSVMDKGSCYPYFISSDSSDFPIAHYLEFDNIVVEENERMWYRIQFNGVTGWVYTPGVYTSEDVYFYTSRDYIGSHPFVRWMPVDPEAILLADVGRQVNQELKELLNENRRLEVDDEIRWVQNDPILMVHVVEKMEDFDWCTQSKKPRRVASGLMYMFLSNKELSIEQMPDIQCD